MACPIHSVLCGEAFDVDVDADVEKAWECVLIPLQEATRVQASVQGAINRNLTSIARLDDRQLALVERLLRTARLRIDNMIRNAGEFDAYILPKMKAEVERIMRDFQQEYLTEFKRAQINIEDLGTSIVQEPLARAGVQLTFPSLPANLTQALGNFHADQIVGITSEAISKISAELSIGMLGGAKPADVIKGISKFLPTPTGAGTITNRAKRIVRTEVNRIHAASTQVRMEQAVKVSPNLRKWWLPAYRNTRPSHVAAGRDYGEYNAIQVDAPYYVGGFPAMYPRDPALPAGESVNCQCRSVPKIVEEE